MSDSLGNSLAKLVSGRTATQVIAFVSAPIITRLFSPEDFGVRQVFASIASILVVIACLRYEFAIPLGKNEKEASAGFALSIFLAIITALFLLVIVSLGKGKIAEWFKMPELNVFLWLIPIATFLGGLDNSLRYWAGYKGLFGLIALSDLSGVLGMALVTIFWAITLGPSPTGLLVAYLADTIFGILLFLIFLGKRLASEIKNADLNFKMLWTVGKTNKKLPILNLWSGLIDTISTNLPPIILGLSFPSAVVGYFSLALKFVTAPTELICSSFGQVFFPNATREYNRTRDISKITYSMYRKLIQLGLFPLLVVFFLGTPLFSLVFGKEWSEAGVYAQILSFWIIFSFATSPFKTVFNILSRQGTGLIFSILMTFGGLLVLLLGVKTGQPRLALGMSSITSALGWEIMLCWILHITGVSLKLATKTFLKYIGLSSLLILPTAYLAWTLNNLFITLISLGLDTIIYVYILYRVDPSIHNFAVTILTKNPLLKRYLKLNLVDSDDNTYL